MFSMSRAKILPGVFSKLHPKYETPYIAVIFTVIVSMAAPWFGREALTWVVDMSSIGVSIAYFYTCFTAYQLFKRKEADVKGLTAGEAAPFKKLIALVGMIASVIFVLFLIVLCSPAFLSIESRLLLLLWIALGVVFYLYKRKEYLSIPEEDLHYLIIGKEKVD